VVALWLASLATPVKCSLRFRTPFASISSTVRKMASNALRLILDTRPIGPDGGMSSVFVVLARTKSAPDVFLTKGALAYSTSVHGDKLRVTRRNIA
jgi:hypothetical protein